MRFLLNWNANYAQICLERHYNVSLVKVIFVRNVSSTATNISEVKNAQFFSANKKTTFSWLLELSSKSCSDSTLAVKNASKVSSIISMNYMNWVTISAHFALNHFRGGIQLLITSIILAQMEWLNARIAYSNSLERIIHNTTASGTTNGVL